jgi:hypothetical protein
MIDKLHLAGRWGLVLAAVLLVACEGYTVTGAKSSSQQDMNGGTVREQLGKANGSSTQTIEVEGGSVQVLDADVTLSVGKGTFKIELLGEGGDDPVTLVLEAGDGQTVSGHGQMVVDSFGEANYRVTAANAENVEYHIVYTFR